MGADPVLAGLLRWPLPSSLSPRLHEAFFGQTGIPGSYALFPVEAGGFEEALSDLRARGYSGLNVTVPHKMRAFRACSGLDGTALASGAVNTLLRSPSGWKGFNTDPEGFGEAVRLSGLRPSFAIVGCGGAGRAIAAELRGRGLAHGVFCGSRGIQGSMPLEALGEFVSDRGCSTVVNATPLGWSDGDGFPLDPALLGGKAFLDLNYNPAWAWRNALRTAGVRVLTGELMLACQAAASFRIWTGVMPDPEKALDEAMAKRGGSRE